MEVSGMTAKINRSTLLRLLCEAPYASVALIDFVEQAFDANIPDVDIDAALAVERP